MGGADQGVGSQLPPRRYPVCAPQAPHREGALPGTGHGGSLRALQIRQPQPGRCGQPGP